MGFVSFMVRVKTVSLQIQPLLGLKGHRITYRLLGSRNESTRKASGTSWVARIVEGGLGHRVVLRVEMKLDLFSWRNHQGVRLKCKALSANINFMGGA